MNHIKIHIVLGAVLCLALSCLMPGPANAAQEWPRPTGPVADYAKVITPQYSGLIDQVSRELLKKTGASLVVATIPSLGDETIEEAAVRLYEKWGIGQKGKDEGILILIAVKDRKLRIEVGYGLEGLITDAKAGLVRDQALVPYLKKGDFSRGLYAATVAFAQIIAKDKGVTLTGVPEARIREEGSLGGRMWGLLILFVVLFFLSRLLRRRGGGGPRGGGGGGLMTGLLIGSMLSGGGRSPGGGGGGFGGFGGGFGGFGGGMSGGGGVSGGW